MQKSNFTTLISILVILFIGIIALSLINIPAKSIVLFILIAAFIGLLFGTSMALVVPSVRLFKHKYILLGIMFGLFFSFLNISEIIDNPKKISTVAHATALIIRFFVAGSAYALITFFIERNKFKKIEPKLPEGEDILFKDTTNYINQEHNRSGMVLLTNHRLIFLSDQSPKFNFDYPASEIGNVDLVYSRIGLPMGIFMPEKNIFLKLKFPKFWKREIEKR